MRTESPNRTGQWLSGYNLHLQKYSKGSSAHLSIASTAVQAIAEEFANSPKGTAALGIREWTCCECGASHNRDLNAARNILALGHERLAGGIPFL